MVTTKHQHLPHAVSNLPEKKPNHSYLRGNWSSLWLNDLANVTQLICADGGVWSEKAPNPTQRMWTHIIIILFSIQNELYGKLLLLCISWTCFGCVPLSFLVCFLWRFIYLSLAVLGLHWCAWAFFSCSEQGLFPSCGVWASYCRDFSCGAQAVACVGFQSCGAWVQ